MKSGSYKKEKPVEIADGLYKLDPLDGFVVNLKKRRELSGYSQRRLAERAGVTQAAIARLEAGQANPTLETLRRVARALHADIRITFVARRRKRVQ